MRFIKRVKTCVVLCAQLAVLSAGLTSAQADEPAIEKTITKQTTCGNAEQIGKELEKRIVQNQATLANLVAFISGKILDDIPIASLFITDLTDSDAIEQRIAQLQQQQKSGLPAPSIAPLLACAKDTASHPRLVQNLTALQASITRLRLDFLSLPKERRATLIDTQTSALLQAGNASLLDRERAGAEQHQAVTSLSLESAEEQSRTAATADLRELAANRAILEKTREELASIKIQFSKDLQRRAQAHQVTAEQLTKLAGALAQTNALGAHESIAQSYTEVATIWRTLVDQIFDRIANEQHYEPIPAIPALPTLLLARLNDDVSATDYRTAYSAAQTEHQQLSRLRQALYTTERNNVFRLLLTSSKLRSALLMESAALGNAPTPTFSKIYFADLYREIRIVPYRLYAFSTTKYLDFREKAQSGMEGLLDITRQILIFALFIAMPFLFYFALRWASGKLNVLRFQMIREQIDLPEARQRSMRIAATAIQRFNAYLPWVVMLFGIWLANRLAAGTDFAELAAVLPYLAYYVWFRIFVTFVAGILGIVAYTGSLQGLTSRRIRVQRIAKQVGAFFFISLAFLHATQDMVGKALVYHLVAAAMVYIGIIIWALAAHFWRKEISSTAKRTLPTAVAVRIERYCSGWQAWIMCLPSMILVVCGLLFKQFKHWAEQTDVFKRLGAEMFRRRVENATPEADREPELMRLPQEYLNWFDLGAPTDSSLLIEPSSGIMKEIQSAVDSWKKETSGEHSLAIIGDKGCGKSSLFRVIEQSCKECQIIRITVPPKLITRDAVLTFFSEQLHHNLPQGAINLEGVDSSHKETLILVDEAHNLFLGAITGFDGYRAFMELVNAGTTNLFWCAAFNRRSWDYLLGVFGNNQYFRNVLAVPPMTDADIQSLILTRHRRSKFNLSYDTIIRATQGANDFGGLAHIETQFFRLLWGQSKGNARAAIVLWISALKNAGDQQLRVSIPHYDPIRGLEQVGDDALFVYAAILRHENLSLQETIATTNLAPGVVQDALRIGIDTSAIVLGTDQRYRASPTAQFALIQLLTGKNFIHE